MIPNSSLAGQSASESDIRFGSYFIEFGQPGRRIDGDLMHDVCKQFPSYRVVSRYFIADSLKRFANTVVGRWLLVRRIQVRVSGSQMHRVGREKMNGRIDPSQGKMDHVKLLSWCRAGAGTGQKQPKAGKRCAKNPESLAVISGMMLSTLSICKEFRIGDTQEARIADTQEVL